MSCGQASMKLPIFACEEFGVHVVKYMQKVRAAKTWRAAKPWRARRDAFRR